MPIKCRYFLFFIILLPGNVWAQESDLTCRWIKTFNQPILLDSQSVDAQSIYFPDHSAVNFQYDYSRGTLVVNSSQHDSIKVCYQAFPFSFHKTYARRTLKEYDSTAMFKVTSNTPTWIDGREELFATSQLYKSGSLSRGISFGNNQDVFVNSHLNLQMEGKLTEDVNISAVITDQSVPFQPEGNTQQLQDFDKVLINLYNEDFSLGAGDVILRHQGHDKGASYFLQYYKNVQGGLLQTNYSMLGGKAKSSVGMSIAKGKFASVQIEAVEGVQGPYRVQGPNNQRFVVILAGSEKVYVDGQLMVRGYNYDYVVDYNLGEITFTNRILITKYTRIRVDFEFADQNYSKSILAAKHEQQWGKTKVFVNAYSEKDNKNRPLTFPLSNEQKKALSTIGDDLDRATISSIDSVGYTDNRVLYKKVDTVDLAGYRQTVLVYSTHPDSALYQAKFTQVAMGKGNYLRSTGTVNGSVFEWVGTDENGLPLGDYLAEVLVPTPQKKQMVTLGLVHDISAEDYIYIPRQHFHPMTSTCIHHWTIRTTRAGH